jgi:hypothetical protein
MDSEVETIGSKVSDFYAEYWHKEELLRVLIRNSEGRVFDERRRLKFEGWLELKSCENPRRTYLNHYRPKPMDFKWARKAGIHVSPAARLGTPPEIEEARRRADRNKPMGCGMKLLLFYLAASALTVLALFVAEQFKR